MRGKSLLNEKAILILSLNQSECRKLLRSAGGYRNGVGWLTLLRLIVLSRSASIWYSKFMVAFLCCHLAF